MLESILSMGGTTTADVLSKKVDLQPHNNNDSMRFQTALNESSDVKADTSILEVKNTDNQITIGDMEKNTAFDSFKHMDTSYHNMLKGMQEMPTYKDFLQSSGINGSQDTIRTNQTGMDTAETMEEKTARLLEHQQKSQEAASDYKSHFHKWYLNSEMFMTKVKVLTSVVSQASQGFKTLFRSSG